METVNRHVDCRVLRGHQQFRLFPFVPSRPQLSLSLIQTNNKKFIKEKPKENNAQIAEETKAEKERERK